jgi:hypothetical protein
MTKCSLSIESIVRKKLKDGIGIPEIKQTLISSGHSVTIDDVINLIKKIKND